MGMFLAYPRLRQGTSEHAHLQRQKKALFFSHSPMDLELDRLRGWACVGYGHRQMLPREGAAPAPTASKVLPSGNCQFSRQGFKCGNDYVFGYKFRSLKIGEEQAGDQGVQHTDKFFRRHG